MNKYLSLILVPLFVLASQLALAGSMTCGTYMIQDEQNPGQTRAEVEEKYGPPGEQFGRRNVLQERQREIPTALQRWQ
jgi:hypothetical protein